MGYEMKGTLHIFILNIQSSYMMNVECPAEGDAPPDTVQWWFSARKIWRIRTYAIDHDIHTHFLNMRDEADLPMDSEAILVEITIKRYGDVLRETHRLELANGNAAQLDKIFEAAGLAPRYEISRPDFLFWKPDGAKYSTKSHPT